MIFSCMMAIAVSVAVAGCLAPGQAKITIDPAKAAIEVSPSAKNAAEELRIHLKLITGVDVPVVEKAPQGAYTFAFEPSKLGSNPEACEWKVTSERTVFGGKVYNAVLDFLEDALDVRWPEGDFIAYKARNPLVVTNLSGAWAPELKLRSIRPGSPRHPEAVQSMRTFAHRMRQGRHDAPVYGHAFTEYWKLHGKDHPEYFAMRKDGIRGPVNVKAEDLAKNNPAMYDIRVNTKLGMCVTSTGLVAQVLSDWKKAGTPKYINLCENDIVGTYCCHCKPCRALDVVPENFDPKWQAHYADRYVWFGNRVLEEARKIRPDVRACYYAYNASQDPPAKVKPDPAVVIGIVPTYFSEEYIARYVGGWKKAGLGNFFYRPNRHHYFDCPYVPLGSEEHFLRIFHYLYKQGAIGFDYDAQQTSPKSFQWFERYVLNHAMQDPSKPFSYWEDHYCSAYENAAEDVKAYYRYWREEVWNKRICPKMDEISRIGKWFFFFRALFANLKDYYKDSDFEAAEKYIIAAEAKELSPVARELVRRLRVCHDHGRIFFHAVAFKSKANTEKLVAYRKKHGYPLYMWGEQFFSDFTGIKELLGPEKKEEKEK